MAWFKVDDGFWSHPKTATLTDAAVTLWVRAGAYSCQHLTDGVVKRPVLRLLGAEDAAVELVDAGLWVPLSDGWRFHDWDEYQETSEAVKQRRADARERQRRAREAAAKKRRESRDLSRVTDGVTDSVSHGVSSLYPTRPDPTRPDPTPLLLTKKREGPPRPQPVENIPIGITTSHAEHARRTVKPTRRRSGASLMTLVGRHAGNPMRAHTGSLLTKHAKGAVTHGQGNSRGRDPGR